MDTQIADDWRDVTWDELIVGQRVWIKGTYQGKFQAYGPHTVHSINDRTLASGTPKCKGWLFMQYHDLIIPKD